MEGSHGSNGLAPRRRLRHVAPAYDEFATTQEKGGVIRQSVYQAEDDPHNLLVTHGFATTAEAEAFLGGADVPDAYSRRVSRPAANRDLPGHVAVPESPAATDHRDRCRAETGPVLFPPQPPSVETASQKCRRRLHRRRLTPIN
jgi:hypothetical protein